MDRSEAIAMLMEVLEDGELALRLEGVVRLYRVGRPRAEGKRVELPVRKIGSGRASDGQRG